MIDIKRLKIAYGKYVVLNDTSLKLTKSYTILGNNGSGKSSFAKAVSGLIPYTGSIKVNEKEVAQTDPKELAKCITYIPPKLESFDQNITLFEFVLFSRYAYKSRFADFSNSDREIANKILEFLDLKILASKTIGNLSSGESALALIATALATNSNIMIFDEPTANLDPKNSKKIAKVIKNLLEKHQILLITHDIALARFMELDVLFMQNSRLSFYEYKTFFCDKTLSNLYGVTFKNMEIFYEN